MRTRAAKRALAARGMVEAVTWSFISEDQAEALRRRRAGSDARQPDRGRSCRTCGPRCCRACSRPPSAMPIGASAMSRCSRSRAGLRERRAGRPARRVAAGVRRGTARLERRRPRTGTAAPSRSMSSTPRPTRSRCSTALGVAGRAACRSTAGGPAWYHPGRSGTLQMGPKVVLGCFGEFHPEALEALDVSGPLVGFEVSSRRAAAAEGEADHASSRRWTCPPSRRSRATSPSSSTRRWKPATWSRPRRAPTAR